MEKPMSEREAKRAERKYVAGLLAEFGIEFGKNKSRRSVRKAQRKELIRRKEAVPNGWDAV